jgi:hypothetical protein
MGSKLCDGCGRQVDSTARAFPGCGRPNLVSGGFRRVLGIVAALEIVSLVAVVVTSCDARSPTKSATAAVAAQTEVATKAPPPVVDPAAEANRRQARELYEYAKNAETKTDMRPALALYEKACAAGEPTGCAVAGYFYSGGQKGVSRNYEKAADFDEKACERNVAGACVNLGILYTDGKGVERDLKRTGALYRKACDLGDKPGCNYLKIVQWKLAVQASDLWKSYSANEVAADNKWKGQQLMVAGLLQSVEKDLMNKVVLGLRSPNRFMPTRAYLNDDELDTAAKLKKGQKVLLTCTCDGRMVGSPVLRSCAINAAETVPQEDD